MLDHNECAETAQTPGSPAVATPAAGSRLEMPTLTEYYNLPPWERWPRVRDFWMEQLLDGKGLGQCVIECAMRDLLDTLHQECAPTKRENAAAQPPRQ